MQTTYMVLYALRIFLLLIVFILFSLNGMYSCPDKCECDWKYVNCTLRNKDTVPTEKELDNTIVKLDLSWNKISSLDQQVFWETRVRELKVIYLNRNSINYINENAFYGLKHLEYVDLSFNNISHISLNVFQWSYNITWLSLAHNPLVEFDASNIGLRSIDLSFCILTNIPNIKAVDVNLENNNITKVGKVKLDYVDKLEKLKLSGNPFICDCDLQDFMDFLDANKIFSSYECSNSGDVNYNMRSGNCTVCPIGCECNYWGIANCIDSKLMEIPDKGFNSSVTTILLSNNKISRVKNYAFLEIKTTDLRHISLNYNRISVIEPHAFKGLSKLEYLDISFNSLINLYDISFYQMHALSWLSISGNILSSVSISSMINITHLDFSNCGINNFTEVAQYWGHSLTWLSLRGNKITFLFKKDLEIMKLIERIDISENPLECYSNLTDAYSWLTTKRLAKNTTCSLPRDLNGKYWQVMETHWINHSCPILQTTEISSPSANVIILILTTCISLLCSLLLCLYILRIRPGYLNYIRTLERLHNIEEYSDHENYEQAQEDDF